MLLKMSEERLIYVNKKTAYGFVIFYITKCFIIQYTKVAEIETMFANAGVVKFKQIPDTFKRAML